DHLVVGAAAFLRHDRMPDRLGKGQALDPLGRPIRRDLGTLHPPDLFGIGLEEYLEQPASEAAGNPLLERLGFRDPPQLDLERGKQTADGRDDAEFAEREKSLQGKSKQLAAIIDTRLRGGVKKTRGQDPRP